MGRGAWQSTVPGVAKTETQLTNTFKEVIELKKKKKNFKKQGIGNDYLRGKCIIG